MAPLTQVPVLIIGGGLVGLTASLCLQYHGIDCIVIERRSGASIHPRARSVNARTMEVFRHLGIDELVREAGAAMSPTFGIHQGTSMKEVVEAKKRAKAERKFPFPGLAASIGPVSGAFVTQDMIEPVLLNTANARGIEVRFDVECEGIEQTGENVIATLKDRKNGSTSTIQAEYLIAADGAKSPIRSQLKVPTIGQGTLGYLLNILFHADLKDFVSRREFSLCMIDRPEVHGLFTSINNSDRWVFHLSYEPSKGEKATDFTPERCKELLRIALGMPGIEIDIKSILPWEPSVRVAEKFQHGRIFLAGDAAHQMPPWGGQGGNSGVADAHNLSWKFAAVLKGKANKTLLETYDEERMPAGLAAAEVSAYGVNERGMISGKKDFTFFRSMAPKIAIVSGHGYAYASKAICAEATGPLGGLTWRPWTLPSLGLCIDGRPGRRAPHLWAEYQGKRISTLDLLGRDFVLLTGPDGKAWLEAAKEVSSTLGIDIAAYRVGPESEVVAPAGHFESCAGISSNGAILIRPDDFVVWRERGKPADHQVNLEQAMRQALCL